jgi:hypothetical protein
VRLEVGRPGLVVVARLHPPQRIPSRPRVEDPEERSLALPPGISGPYPPRGARVRTAPTLAFLRWLVDIVLLVRAREMHATRSKDGSCSRAGPGRAPAGRRRSTGTVQAFMRESLWRVA